MKRVSVSILLFSAIISSSANAASSRNMCEKFFPNWNLSQCIQQQESSAGRINGWMNKPNGRYKQWAESCRSQNLIPYGVTHYVNYVGTEKCVMQLKRESDQAHQARVQQNAVNNSQMPQTLFMTNGQALNRAAGGYTGPDGTFYSDAAGGIVNTRTGQFLPVH